MLTIKLCTTEDELQALVAVAKKIWNEYYLGILSKEQIEYMVEEFQSYDAIKEMIQDCGFRYYLAYEDDVLIGYMGACPEPLDKPETMFLSKLYLDASARGKGYASALFNKAVEWCKDLGLNRNYLTCNKQNQHSLDVYLKKGFKIVASAESQIGHGFIMDDYVMEWKF